MKRILIDTNIILDIALQRANFYVSAQNVLTYLYENEIPTFVSASTVTDIYYILRKDKGHQNTIDFLKNLFDFIDIAGVDKLTIMEALESDISDFEDAVQITVAQQYDCQMILTRNKSDFVNTNLEVYTAEEYGQMIN